MAGPFPFWSAGISGRTPDMCFSETASLTAGILLSGAGLFCIVSAPSLRHLPIAAMPLLFGMQQLIEAGLWRALLSGDAALEGCFASGFSVFAFVVWPVYVPWAIWLVERTGWRRRLIAACGVAGLAVATLLLEGLVTVPVVATINGDHIHYRSSHIDGLFNAGLFVPCMALYVVATCLSPVLSQDRSLRSFGAAMAAAFVISYVFYEQWLVSVWCFLAAALSAVIGRWVSLGDNEPLIIPPVRTS